MTDAAIQLEHLGVLPRIGLKGPAAAQWLSDRSVEIPPQTFATCRHSDGTLIARLGETEFMLEATEGSDLVARLEPELASLGDGVYSIPRGEVTLVISQNDCRLLFAQTCGVDFRSQPSGKLIYTRVAGVSCSILPVTDSEPRYRLWVDFGFAPYLWETLSGITKELGGVVQSSATSPAPSAVGAH
ncbi:MAG: hypothetical protein AB7G28_09005 [Pirellulales bacterium]